MNAAQFLPWIVPDPFTSSVLSGMEGLVDAPGLFQGARWSEPRPFWHIENLYLNRTSIPPSVMLRRCSYTDVRSWRHTYVGNERRRSRKRGG